MLVLLVEMLVWLVEMLPWLLLLVLLNLVCYLSIAD